MKIKVLPEDSRSLFYSLVFIPSKRSVAYYPAFFYTKRSYSPKLFRQRILYLRQPESNTKVHFIVSQSMHISNASFFNSNIYVHSRQNTKLLTHYCTLTCTWMHRKHIISTYNETRNERRNRFIENIGTSLQLFFFKAPCTIFSYQPVSQCPRGFVWLEA